MRAALASPFIIHGKEIFASASIGIALYPEDGNAPDDLFARADVAMYDAKRNGRGGIRFYVQELSGKAARRLALGTSLHSALVNGELELFFQPKMRLVDSAVVGAEALLRWRHPELGLLTPDAFIGIAEDTGLIVEIGRWVLETACAQAVAWNAGRPDVNAGAKMHRLAGVKMHQGVRSELPLGGTEAPGDQACCGSAGRRSSGMVGDCRLDCLSR